MTLTAARLTGKVKWIYLLFVVFLLACQFSIPGQQAVPTSAPTIPPVGTSVPPTVTPTTQPGYPPGTVILDQTNPLSAAQGSKVELPFEAVAFQVISVKASLVGGTLTYELHLVDKFGNFLATLESKTDAATETISEFTLPYNGTYQIVLSPVEGDGSVQVVITALEKPSGGGALSGVGSNSGGMMSAPGVYHTYEFPLTQGDVVTIAAKANVNGAPDTRLVLYGPDGRYVTDADDVAPPTDLNAVVSGYVVPTTGTYTAIVSNFGGAIGAYVFSVTSDTIPPEAQGNPDITYDQPYTASFFEGSNLNVTFDGTLGDALRIEVFDVQPGVDVDIYLHSPFGQIIAYAVSAQKGQGEAINEVQLPYSGRYRLEFKPYGAGDASFRVNHLTLADLTGGGLFGDDLTGVLPGRFAQPNVFHIYQFNAAAGDKVSLVVYSVSEQGQLEIGFALLGPNGLQLAFADDSQSDNPSDPELTDYEVTQTGTFTVIVYSFNDATGTYELEYTRK